MYLTHTVPALQSLRKPGMQGGAQSFGMSQFMLLSSQTPSLHCASALQQKNGIWQKGLPSTLHGAPIPPNGAPPHVTPIPPLPELDDVALDVLDVLDTLAALDTLDFDDDLDDDVVDVAPCAPPAPSSPASPSTTTLPPHPGRATATTKKLQVKKFIAWEYHRTRGVWIAQYPARLSTTLSSGSPASKRRTFSRNRDQPRSSVSSATEAT